MSPYHGAKREAADPHTSSVRLAELANHDDEPVRLLVVKNPTTSYQTLADMTLDPSWSIH